MPYLGIFFVNTLTPYCQIWKKHRQIFQIAIFSKKNENAWISDQKFLIWDFFRCVFKNCYHVWNQHPQICLVAKIFKKIKMPNFGPKLPYWLFLTNNALFGYFLARIIKNYWHIWNQHPQICRTPKVFTKELKDLYLGPAFPYLAIFRVEC